MRAKPPADQAEGDSTKTCEAARMLTDPSSAIALADDRTLADLSDEELLSVFPGSTVEHVDGEQPIALRPFTFPSFERLTPDLGASERLAVFLGLPLDLQAEAWDQLGDLIESRGREQWAAERLGTCTARELADEIARLWRQECGTVPLAGIRDTRSGEQSPAPRRALLPRGERDRDLDVLRSIPSAEFVEQLTGLVADGSGFVRCPFHGGGEERTPSLHVDFDEGRWYCHSCAEGGGLIEFWAKLNARTVPPGGAEFASLVREVAAAVLGRPA